MAEHTFRKATQDDAPAISALIGALRNEPEPIGIQRDLTSEEVATWIQRLGERGGIFVCEIDGRVAGFGVLNINMEDPTADPDSAGIGVWVLASERKKGLGTELAECALEHARANGFKRIRGILPQDNEVALSFLSSIGALVPIYNPEARYELPLI